MSVGALTNLMQISRWMPFGSWMLHVSGATGTYLLAYGAFIDMGNYRYDAGRWCLRNLVSIHIAMYSQAMLRG